MFPDVYKWSLYLYDDSSAIQEYLGLCALDSEIRSTDHTNEVVVTTVDCSKFTMFTCVYTF